MKAVQVVAFGRAAEVVKLNEVPDVGSPGPNEVVVAVEAAPINNSDFMIMAGRYGYRDAASDWGSKVSGG